MILSDGEQSGSFGGSASAITDAQTLKDAGITVFAVGFGGVQASTLNAIASQPSSQYSYLGTNIQAIQQHFSDFCSVIASPQPPPSPLPPGFKQPPSTPPSPPSPPSPSPPPPLPAVPPTPPDYVILSHSDNYCAVGGEAAADPSYLGCSDTHVVPTCFRRIHFSATLFLLQVAPSQPLEPSPRGHPRPLFPHPLDLPTPHAPAPTPLVHTVHTVPPRRALHPPHEFTPLK